MNPPLPPKPEGGESTRPPHSSRSPSPQGDPNPGPGSAKAPLFDSGYVTAMSHFYRGEMGRIMSWRTRIDTTTQWAITVTSTIFTVAFSVREVPHVIFLFNIGIVWMLLWIEARRYRFYDAFRARVRLLETHFLVPMVYQNNQMLHGDWQRLMCEDLLLPSFKISRFEALGRRLKRNYLYIFMIILGAWLTKIILHAPEPVQSWRGLYDAIGAGHGAPAWLVVSGFILTFVTVITTSIYISRKSPGEFNEFGSVNRALWKH